MKHLAVSDRVLDTSALVGIMAGLAMLLTAFFVPDIAALAAPACVVLVASLLCGMREREAPPGPRPHSTLKASRSGGEGWVQAK